MNKKLTSTLLAAALATGVVACSRQETQQQTATTATSTAATSTQQMPAGHPPVDEALQAAAGKIAGKTYTGKIAETKDAAGFTYVRLATAEGDVWIALPQTQVKVGQDLTVIESMATENFESKSLGRKFDRLVFGKLPGDDKAMPAGHGGAMGMGGENPHGKTPEVDAGPINVARAEGGKTVEEIWGEKNALKDKPVTVAGKVVKFLPGIMGKNWLHLRDGSGNQEKGTNDITVTTNDQVKVGDTVVVKGTVRVGKDFGAGYAYEVIVEDAKIASK